MGSDQLEVPTSLNHTAHLPLFAINPSIINDIDAGIQPALYMIRFTPRSLCAADWRRTSERLRENSFLTVWKSGSPSPLLTLAGLEDARAVVTHRTASGRRTLWIVAGSYHPGSIPASRMVLIRREWPSLRPVGGRVELYYGNSTRNEKNWIPFVVVRDGGSSGEGSSTGSGAASRVLFSYQVEPHIVLGCNAASGACAARHQSSAAALWTSRTADSIARRVLDHHTVSLAEIRGSTTCVMLRDLNICIAHWHNNFMRYYHWIYAFTPRPPYTVAAVSYPFRFLRFYVRDPPDKQRDRLQFAAGLAPMPGTAVAAGEPSHLTVSYGVGDCLCAETNISVAEVMAMLRGELVKLEL